MLHELMMLSWAVLCAGRRSTTEARDSMSGRRVSSTPSQAYDERPAVAAGSSPAAMQAAPAPARRSARGSLNDALSASSAADTTGARTCHHYRQQLGEQQKQGMRACRAAPSAQYLSFLWTLQKGRFPQEGMTAAVFVHRAGPARLAG